MTYYDYVNNQVQAGLWEQTQFMFGRNATALDFYYRIYTLVRKYYPERKKGYAVQFVHNEDIMRSIGGGYSPDLKLPDTLEPYEVRHAVMVMEKPFRMEE